MSTFQNITEVDLFLTIDGVAIPVEAGGSFTIPDAYDFQLVEQPYYKQLSAKDAKAADPIVPRLDPPEPLVAPDFPDAAAISAVSDPATPAAATPEAPAATVGGN